MDIGRAGPDDYSEIYELMAANSDRNLSPTDRKKGFLSATFTLRQIADMAADLGILVARDKERVVGVMCASRCDFADQPPVVRSMVAEFDRVRYQDQPLNEYSVFLYGPVCIAPAYRGRGLLRALYQAIRRELDGKCDVGVAFVSEANPHSLEAHVQGLGMSEVGRFTHDEHGYRILAFPIGVAHEGENIARGRD